jgi:repressor LexA
VERSLRVSRWLFRLQPDYLVRVIGDSMRDEGILDGDLVAVHATPVARHGQVVAARVAGDRFTIKRLYWQGDVIRLLPNSPGYQPIDPDPTEDFAIEGLFAGLVRGS